MGSMFAFVGSVTTLDLSNWDTSSVKDMGSMFWADESLTSIKFGSKWNTKEVENMKYMFEGCSNLTSLDLSNWDTSSVKDMGSMFRDLKVPLDFSK